MTVSLILLAYLNTIFRIIVADFGTTNPRASRDVLNSVEVENTLKGSPSRAVMLEKNAGNDLSCLFWKKYVLRGLDLLADVNGSDENEADEDAVS
jgi:hypothetical protein